MHERSRDLDQALVEVAYFALFFLPDLLEGLVALEESPFVEVAAALGEVAGHGYLLGHQVTFARLPFAHRLKRSSRVRATLPGDTMCGRNIRSIRMAKKPAAQKIVVAHEPAVDHQAHDSHGHDDPNAAPMRSDVREQFSSNAVLFCAILGAVAIVAGTFIGLTVVNN